MARGFSEIPNAYVILILDCCRKNFNDPKYRAGADEGHRDSTVYRNLIIINGCPPNGRVDARSSIATEFFTKLSSCADINGTIILPGNLLFWQPGNEGDKVIDIRQYLHFHGPLP